MAKQFIQAPGVAVNPNYSHAVRVGNTIYVAGQTGRDANGNVVGLNDPAAQATQAIENLSKILEAAGASLKDVVKITAYMVNPDHRTAIQGVRRRYFKEPLPGSTGVTVTALAHPDLLFEIEAVAVVD